MLAFLLTSLAAQWLRGDLDWMRVPNSFYLIGPWSGMVRAGYLALAAALVLLGGMIWRASPRARRNAAAPALFIAAAAALTVTTFAATDVPAAAPTLHGFVHGVAAQAAFLCTTTAMLLAAWRLRREPGWRSVARPACTAAALCFVLPWVLALWRGLPRGLAQKGLMLLILACLAVAVQLLPRCAPDAEGAP